MPNSQQSLGRLTQGALETLRARIVAGELPPGQRLLEPALTQELSISRTPIREALRVLHAERLLVLRPGGGYEVAPVNVEQAREVYEVRGALEGMVAGEAALRWTDRDRADLERVLDRASLLLDYEEDLKVLGKEFHRVVRRIAGNQLAEGILRDLEPHSDRLRHYTQHVLANRRIAIEQHRAVVEAIIARDAARASEAMREHMVSGWERLRVEMDAADASAEPDEPKTLQGARAGRGPGSHDEETP